MLCANENASKAPCGATALWNLGFRPFYLCAAIFAAIAIALWVARVNGWLTVGAYLDNSLWHAHEMIFGYSFAVVVGFLFTAVRNWTGQPTPSGKVLMLTVALWVEARVLLALGLPVPAAIVDAAFAIAVAWGIAMPLRAGGNRRNMFFVAVLLAIGAANVVFTLAVLGAIDLPPQRMLRVALDLILFVMVVMGGRVIPMFTANAVASNPRRDVRVERVALGAVLALLGADLLAAPAPLLGVLAALAAVAHGVRFLLWQPWRTLQRPILWILHLSYAWVVVHLALRAAAAWQPDIGSLATHALTVGGIGGLTLGMMTRTARGHTGRPLVAEKMEVAAYVLVQLGAVLRVLLPLCLPAWYMHAVTWSGVLWCAAFLLFAIKYAPMLWRPRVDGKPG